MTYIRDIQPCTNIHVYVSVYTVIHTAHAIPQIHTHSTLTHTLEQTYTYNIHRCAYALYVECLIPPSDELF